jgi:alcohol dehydrogenase class IV
MITPLQYAHEPPLATRIKGIMPAAAWNVEFLMPARIVFGWGSRREVGALARSLARRVFLFTGSRSLEAAGTIDEIVRSLEQAGVAVEPVTRIDHEPLVGDVDRATHQLRELSACEGDCLVAVGGGSAIDLAKAAAAMATNSRGHSVADFLEGVGRGLVLRQAPLPLIAMPTTGGTGTEATKNAVISSLDPPFKKSLRSPQMVPRVALIDPELTIALPPATTAYTGMDAITQLIESYVTRRAQPLTQALSLAGLELAAKWIREAVHNGSSRFAREAMAQAALFSGLALANSGLGLAHGVAAALGIHARVPHGLACAVMLPAAMRVNRPVCELEFGRLGEVLAGRRFSKVNQAADAAVEAIDELCRDLAIPQRLSELGVRREQLSDLVTASRGNSMSGNPRELSDAELAQLLEAML